MMGGALGLAILASLAAATTNGAIAAGADTVSALADGYHAAFAIGASFATLASILAIKVLRVAPAAPALDADSGAGEIAVAAD